MSIFASRTQKVVEIPFDPPHTVTVQKLAGRHLEQAKQANQAAAAATVQRMGGAEFQRQLASIPTPTVAALAAKFKADPFNGYDRDVVLKKGIVAWTYVDDEGHPIPVTPAAIEDLDEEATELLAREILQLTKPALFLTAEEQDAKKKPASEPSSLA